MATGTPKRNREGAEAGTADGFFVGGPSAVGTGDPLRVLVAIEERHRVYGEAISLTLQERRPDLDVFLATPESFCEEIDRLDPGVVVYGGPALPEREDLLAWVTLSLDPRRPTQVRVGEVSWEITNPSFGDLVSVVDEAALLHRLS